MIRGKKNFIPASRLEMGLAIVFRIDESSVAHHLELEALENDDVDDAKPRGTFRVVSTCSEAEMRGV